MNVVDSHVAEYKQRVLADWATDETAVAWQKHYLRMKEQLAEVTQALVDAADPRPGMQVLDLASGTGEPSLSLARRIAPNGRVTATDLSTGMLSALRHNAAVEEVSNIEFQIADAHELPFEGASFDRVTSRFGCMFFVDIRQALSEIRRVLRSDGRVALLVWGPAAPETLFGDSAVPFLRRMAQPPDPDGPGPMRFAEPGKLARELEQAAFRDVREEFLTLSAPWRGSPEDLLASTLEIAAPFRKGVASLSEEDRQAAQDEVLTALHRNYDGTFTHTKAPVLILTAVK